MLRRRQRGKQGIMVKVLSSVVYVGKVRKVLWPIISITPLKQITVFIHIFNRNKTRRKQREAIAFLISVTVHLLLQRKPDRNPINVRGRNEYTKT